jgi:hypothetical protein
MAKEQTTWEKREEFEDGTYNEVRVRKVKNGFIKSTTRHYKEDDEWKYEDEETVHTENPMEEPSLIEKLAAALKE